MEKSKIFQHMSHWVRVQNLEWFGKNIKSEAFQVERKQNEHDLALRQPDILQKFSETNLMEVEIVQREA